MATLNTKVKKGTSSNTVGKTTNKAGGKAYELKDISKLVTGVLTSFFNEDKYYGDNSKEIVELTRKVVKKDPEFIANLASYTRKVFHLRTISQMLLAELAHGAKGTEWTRKACHHVIERADDMTGTLSYYLNNFTDKGPNKHITRGLRRGLGDVFVRFDEYALAKYKQSKKEVKLKDVLKLIRIKPVDEKQAELWGRLKNDTLAVPMTRETMLTEHGNNAKTWETLVKENKLGYMACLRNLKNIVETDAKILPEVLKIIKDPKKVLKSKQLPFRFFTAYKMMESVGSTKVNKVLLALEDAMDISVENVLNLQGTTFMTSDNSASMTSRLSEHSMVRYVDVANLLMSIAHKFCDESITSVFGEAFKVVNVTSRSSILSNMQKFERTSVGHSTNLYLSIEYLIKNKIKVDRIIVFSDMQAYSSTYSYSSCQTLLSKYKKEVNPKVWMHSIDLTGHGSTQFIGDRVNLIAGWSEKVLEFINMSETAEGGLIKKIRNFKLD